MNSLRLANNVNNYIQASEKKFDFTPLSLDIHDVAEFVDVRSSLLQDILVIEPHFYLGLTMMKIL